MIKHMFTSLNAVKIGILQGATFTLAERKEYPLLSGDRTAINRPDGRESRGITFATFRTVVKIVGKVRKPGFLYADGRFVKVYAKTKGNRFIPLGTLDTLNDMERWANLYSYKHGEDSRFDKDTYENYIFTLFWEGILIKALPFNLEFWQPVRCAMCKRVLTDPVSIEQGMGLKCSNKKGDNAYDK